MSKFYDTYWSDSSKNIIDKELHKKDFNYKWPVIKRLIPKESGITILDFGCGNGVFIKHMREINPRAKFIGIDVSRIAIEKAKRTVPDAKFYVVEDGNIFPIRNSQVDFILASDVIEHVYNTETTFRELARVLKHHGKILMTTPYHGLIKNILISIIDFDLIFNPEGPHVRFYTKKSLLRSLKKVKLKAVDFGYYGRFFPIPNAMYVLAEK